MSFSLYLAFAGATFLICGTPGPNMLLAMIQGINHGYCKAVTTMLGTMTGMLIILSVSLGGLGALLVASAHAFSILKYIGAAYLIYLGLKTWRAQATSLLPAVGPARRGGAFTRYRTGLLVSLFNPKAILFGIAFFSAIHRSGARFSTTGGDPAAQLCGDRVRLAIGVRDRRRPPDLVAERRQPPQMVQPRLRIRLYRRRYFSWHVQKIVTLLQRWVFPYKSLA